MVGEAKPRILIAACVDVVGKKVVEFTGLFGQPLECRKEFVRKALFEQRNDAVTDEVPVVVDGVVAAVVTAWRCCGVQVGGDVAAAKVEHGPDDEAVVAPDAVKP